MSFITMAQAISSVVGGVPVQPAGANTVIEKLRAAKSMLPGNMGGILNQIMSGGPGAILQNPMGSLMGGINGQLGGLLSGISANGLNLPGVMNALTGTNGLQAAMGNLSQVTSALSGLTAPTEGGFGLLDAIGHANITSMFGDALPASLGLDKAMAPLMMETKLGNIASQLTSITPDILSGAMSDADAASAITGMRQVITTTINASNNAFSAIQDQAVTIANVSAIVSLIASGPEEMGPIANKIIKESAKPQIQAIMDEQLYVPPIDV